MNVILAEESRRARKHHLCEHCQCSIVPGEVYYHQRGIWEGAPYTSKAHADCQALADAIHRAGNLCWDEGVLLCEEERDELVLWRGSYPHAVCRVELGWELARQRYARRAEP